MRELNYYVTKNDISPKEIKECGFAGEHLATRIIFNLSEDFDDSYNYFLQIVNGGGEFFFLDELILSDNSIIYDLPNSVTAVSGICSLQLVIKDDEKIKFCFPAKIRFLSSAEKTSGAINYISEITDALTICKDAAKKAENCINTVNDNSAEFNRINGDISNALDYILALQEEFMGGNL